MYKTKSQVSKELELRDHVNNFVNVVNESIDVDQAKIEQVKNSLRKTIKELRIIISHRNIFNSKYWQYKNSYIYILNKMRNTLNYSKDQSLDDISWQLTCFESTLINL